MMTFRCAVLMQIAKRACKDHGVSWKAEEFRDTTLGELWPGLCCGYTPSTLTSLDPEKLEKLEPATATRCSQLPGSNLN